jgi:N-acetylneuraminic acid mutarotase
LTGVSPTLVGAKVFGQAWTSGLGNPFVTSKSNVVTVILGAHGVSTPTHLPPLNPHAYAVSSRLANGNILVAGGGAGLGSSGSGLSEVYDYRSSSFFMTGNLATDRAAGTGVILNDGRVLITGGVNGLGTVTNACELYDPATNLFTPTGAMATPRVLHTLVKLNDGRVLAAGGSTAVSGTDPVAQLLSFVNNATATAELYNPATGTWAAAANLPSTRTGHSAAIVPDGRVLVAGGVQPGILGIPQFLTSATRYNPASNAWNATASMGGTARAISSVSTLADGRVMVAGGVTASIVTLSATAVPDVSIYNNGTNTWQNGPNLAAGRYAHGLTTLPNGRVVALGGVVGTVSSTTTPITTAAVESYNPLTNAWSPLIQLLQPRAAASIHLTPDGKRVVVIGGSNDVGPITPGTAELYVP